MRWGRRLGTRTPASASPMAIWVGDSEIASSLRPSSSRPTVRGFDE